ncbi:isopentenyl-diphosphate Delta-isomerase 1-like isoform X2 [Saccostrea echinata]|uniref:isopentenyl-diphosphate Delta-isomerase 1-like isoform X2 n=1 Tax=Saccostrea echinata TaxID=191078 RepID=UPI002A81B2C6|nr:isopentenyl-diphosphate Delta-isomerase 1-like isoform X2 [Saccostrea echinata]
MTGKSGVFCWKQQLTWSTLKRALSTTHRSVLEGYDKTQAALMEEECILTDRDDKVMGKASKKTCHLMQNINKGHFTNTCCSHPLHTPTELEGHDALGVKRAAQRKLQHELGIDPNKLSTEDLKFLTRVHYLAENAPDPGVWGEHEIDYILIAQKDVAITANPNEVKSHVYVNRQQLLQMMDKSRTGDILITPWFRLIVDKFLMNWWDNLPDIEQHKDNHIHRLCDK